MIAVVLRVADAALVAGRLAGEVELVATGERSSVRSAEELVAFLRRGSPVHRDQTVDTVGDEHREGGSSCG